MASQDPITFTDLKSNISDSIKETCQTSDALICKIADDVHQIHTVSVEPGVEIVQGLSTIIDATVKNAVKSGCDLTAVVQGILIGAFRSNRSIRLEAHKTIHLLIKEITRAVFKYDGDIRQLIDGLLASLVMVADEQKLNTQEILFVGFEDLISSSREINPQFALKVIAIIPKEYEGWKVVR